MNNWIKKFNLVEVIIAMGIIVVCITTILGLVSAGMKVSKDVSSKVYTNLILEQVTGLIETNPAIQLDLDNMLLNNPPTDGTYIPVTKKVTDNTDARNAEFVASYGSYCGDRLTDNDTLFEETDPSYTNFRFNDSGSASLGLFVVDFRSNIGTVASPVFVTDFSAAVRVWLDSTNSEQVSLSEDTGANPLSFRNRIINIEITWPISDTYSNRELAGNIVTYRKILNP